MSCKARGVIIRPYNSAYLHTSPYVYESMHVRMCVCGCVYTLHPRRGSIGWVCWVGVPGSRIDPGRGLALFVCFLLISIDISFYIYWVTRRSIYRLVDWIRVFVNADTID